MKIILRGGGGSGFRLWGLACNASHDAASADSSPSAQFRCLEWRHAGASVCDDVGKGSFYKKKERFFLRWAPPDMAPSLFGAAGCCSSALAGVGVLVDII